MTCPVCNQETPLCPCDYAVMEMSAKLHANYDRWVERGRHEVAADNNRMYGIPGVQVA